MRLSDYQNVRDEAAVMPDVEVESHDGAAEVRANPRAYAVANHGASVEVSRVYVRAENHDALEAAR